MVAGKQEVALEILREDIREIIVADAREFMGADASEWYDRLHATLQDAIRQVARENASDD